MGVQVLVQTRPGGTDDYNNPVESDFDPVTYTGCDVWPRGSVEDAGRSATVVTGYTAIIYDPTAEILPGDEITWDGDTYKVEGRPGKWKFRSGQFAGWQIALEFQEA